MKSEDKILSKDEFRAEVNRFYNLIAECIELNPCDASAACAALGKVYFAACCEVELLYQDFEAIADDMKLRYKKHSEEGK